jgi:glycerol-3-phosphate dehydrogenase
VNQCELLEAPVKLDGIAVKDRHTGNIARMQARTVVHASGQWLSRHELSHRWVRLSKGIHLILPRVLDAEALLLTAKSDGRVFFMIPWYGLTLVGTTDTNFQGDVEKVEVEANDIAYLLAEVNHYLNMQFAPADVIGSYAGLRVLRQSDAASPSAVSRDWEIKSNGQGVFYSVGGKLTSAREDASSMVDAVCKHLGIAIDCPTFAKNFPWTPDDFAAWASSITAQALKLGIDAESAYWLIRRHGKRASDILSDVERDASLTVRIHPSLPFIYADFLFCARTEMVVHLEDLLRRRTPLLILAKWTSADLRLIAERVAPILGWDQARVEQELEQLLPRVTSQET